jgi:hypothetical protein
LVEREPFAPRIFRPAKVRNYFGNSKLAEKVNLLFLRLPLATPLY